jgi:alanyl-tRNA synthetase
MTGNDLRQKYLEFFESKDSLVVPSSSLIPTDPTTLLTSAGMQPLVPYFKGEEEPPKSRLASCQKCCRADDIEQVGVTWRHASFFEMLGNFSFGDYFKREAIVWGWEFLTKTLGIDPKVLWVSVYHDDTEAPEIWKRDVGLSDDRIYRFGKKDNWWGPVGKSGPCGPDSEIFFDRGPKYDTGDPEMDRPGGDGDRYGEIWNLVFQQYNQQESGELLPLPAPGIDTGMGLERTAAILQGVDTIHHTDLFAPITQAIVHAGKVDELPFISTPLELNPEDPTTWPIRVIADHIRAAVFMAGDGIVPGNNGRDYMLRRFIRRAFLMGRKLGYEKAFLHRIVPVIAQGYGDIYPEVRTRQQTISDLIRREEERFESTLSDGVNRLDNLIESLQDSGQKTLPGDEVFRLYETFGFPLELTREIAGEQDISIDEEGYHVAAERHAARSGTAVGEYEKRRFGLAEIDFVGYDQTRCEATILEFVSGENGRSFVLLDRTPFYAESGGQIGDTGELAADGFKAIVHNTTKDGKAWSHEIEVIEGELQKGLRVEAIVDLDRRRAIERAHSATHLLHAALRQHLGAHVAQRGSLVEPDRLRFDFVHHGPMSDEELMLVEDTVNAEILRSIPVEISYASLAEARAAGAMALFGEKYGDVVRTVKMGDFSLELCGGTHLQTTSAAGLCRIVSEGGVSANTRRMVALTGQAALRHDRDREIALRETAKHLGAQPDNVVGAAEKLRQRVRELERQLQQAQQKMASASAGDLLSGAVEINGVKLVATRAPQGLSANALRDLADQLAQKLDGVVALAGESEGKVLLAVKAAPSAVAKGAHAGNLVRELAKTTGGGGGGRPDFAQAGGKDATKIDDALNQAQEVLAGQIK